MQSNRLIEIEITSMRKKEKKEKEGKGDDRAVSVEGNKLLYVSFCVLIGCLVFMKQRATSHELTTRVNRLVSRSTQSS